MMLTLDLDDTEKPYMMWTAKKLLDVGAKAVYARRSSSGDGWHVKAFGLPSYHDRWVTRLLLGDDALRLQYDLRHASKGVPIDITFDKKGEGSADEWKHVAGDPEHTSEVVCYAN